MTVNKRNKYSRMRGTSSHGWGSKKKHRGAGHRGGKGMAGTGKRADQKKPTILNLYGNDYYGKKGFRRPQKKLLHIKTLNLVDLQKNLDKYVKQKLVAKEGEFYVVDLSNLGYNKLLGRGELNVKLKVRADYYSESAISKVEEKGGVVLNKEDVSAD